MRTMRLLLTLGALLFVAQPSHAFPETPSDLKAFDTPSDNGKSISLTWSKMPGESKTALYVIEVAEAANGPWYFGESTLSTKSFKADFPAVFLFDQSKKDETHAINVTTYVKDDKKQQIKMDKEFFLRLVVKEGKKQKIASVVSVTPKGNWFATNKLNNFVFMLLLVLFVLGFTFIAKRSPNKLYIRKIAGLDAVDEALGRATEMGKPVFFVHGIETLAKMSTLAAINILGRIAGKVAEFDATLKVTNYDPIVMAVSQETVKEAYIKAGRPDAYNEENVPFTAADQFSYAATVEGMMVREKPAANFFMGYFFAESLLLAEVGNSTGAIQIAGTDAYTQLPFFVTTCDYTLMGEELYAASAYLSREPKLLGSLKGQDTGKGIVIAVLIIGSILSTAGIGFLSLWLTSM